MDNSAQLAEMIRAELEEHIMATRNNMEIGLSDMNIYWKEVGKLAGYRLAITVLKEQLYKLNNEELEDDDE